MKLSNLYAELFYNLEINHLNYLKSKEAANLLLEILEYEDEIDTYLSDGGVTLADLLMDCPYTSHLVPNLSSDPLFSLLEPNINFTEFFEKSDKVHIGVSFSHEKIVPAFIRIFHESFLEIEFHLITLDILNNNPHLIKKFSGWINPGGRDTYPRDLMSFSISDWEKEGRLEFEHLYHLVLENVFKYNLPYFGICAGAQHMVLNRFGSLKPVKGYEEDIHEVNYGTFSLSTFLALNNNEKNNLMLNCEMPEISFDVLTYNNYAALSHALGEDVILGVSAAADDTIALAYHISNGLQFATQYHIEESYNIDYRQTQIIDNFLNIAKQLHKSKHDENSINPQIIYPIIEKRLQECTYNPNCKATIYQDMLNYNETWLITEDKAALQQFTEELF